MNTPYIPSNSIYLDMLGVKQENKQKCLEAMGKYGENRWWLSDDPKTRAYYQSEEPVLLLKNLSQFQEDMCALLDRRIFKHEMRGAKFHQEAERAWTYGVGATSDKERKERFEESLQDLRDMGKEVLFVEPSMEERDA